MSHNQGDDSSYAMSNVSFATSSTISRHSRGGRKKKKKKGDDEDWSHVTPVISNTQKQKAGHGEEPKDDFKKRDNTGIDYGQLVVDSRTSDVDNSHHRTNSEATTRRGDQANSNNDDDDATEVAGNTNTSGGTGDGATATAGTSATAVPLPTINELSDSPTPKSLTAVIWDKVWLPLFVALFATTRFILSTAASLSCKFIKISIGFTPMNVNFMKADVFVSPWAFHDGDQCLGYPDDFTSEYIKGESSWTTARVAAVINIVFGCVVFLVASFVGIYRVMRMYPASARGTTCIKGFNDTWEVIIFFLVIIMFVVEVMKFVFWGINLCTEEVWLTSTYNLLTAEGGCELASGARCAMSALIFDLAIIMTLTGGSNNLRTTLASWCMCTCCGKDRIVIEDEEMPGPRYFFESNDDDDDDEKNHVAKNKKDNDHDSNEGDIDGSGDGDKSRNSESFLDDHRDSNDHDSSSSSEDESDSSDDSGETRANRVKNENESKDLIDFS